MTTLNRENEATLEAWLAKATRHLSADSARRVRAEIREHYETARESAISSGQDAGSADRTVLAALGDAKAANREYRKVLLTSAEAKLLRDAAWEARAVCSRRWLKRLVPAAPVALLLAAAASFVIGAVAEARILLAGAIGLGFFLTAPFLPLYTPSRARMFRRVKWTALTAALFLVFGPTGILQWSWLLASCSWPLIWIEWTRVSIRRKLPVAEWPRQLYL
jgi:hypothetical protein